MPGTLVSCQSSDGDEARPRRCARRPRPGPGRPCSGPADRPEQRSRSRPGAAVGGLEHRPPSACLRHRAATWRPSRCRCRRCASGPSAVAQHGSKSRSTPSWRSSIVTSEPSALKHARQLHGDVAAAHHQPRGAAALEREEAIGGDAELGAPDLGDGGPAAGRDHDVVGACIPRRRPRPCGIAKRAAPRSSVTPRRSRLVVVDAVEAGDVGVAARCFSRAQSCSARR
jgi:hypothetical protein